MDPDKKVMTIPKKPRGPQSNKEFKQRLLSGAKNKKDKDWYMKEIDRVIAQPPGGANNAAAKKTNPSKTRQVEQTLKGLISIETFEEIERRVPAEKKDMLAFFVPIKKFGQAIAKVQDDIDLFSDLEKLVDSHGTLNWTKLIKDKVVQIGYENKQVIPIKAHVEGNNDVLIVGQINSHR